MDTKYGLATMIVAIALGGAGTARTGASLWPDGREELPSVTVHPPVAARYACSEHYEGEYQGVFDALGQDCVIVWNGRTHTGEGTRNQDHHIWGVPVLAPFDGRVERITVNPVVNEPGTLGTPPATSVIFQGRDDVRVGYAHVDRITVKEGESVAAGQPFAAVSNNGMSSSPHLHVGAWKGDTPVQIRWDLRALGRMRNRR
jgi:hypothetical protein